MAEDIQVVDPNYETDQQLDIGVQTGPMEGTYSSRVQTVKDKFLVVEVPKVNGLYLPIDVDQEILLKHYREGATYEAESSVNLRNDDRDHPTMVLSKPEEIKRIQRRDFVRVPCDIEVTVRVINVGQNGSGESLPDSFSATIDDISAGGVQLKGPENLPLYTDVELLFTLPGSETTMNEVFAEVVRESDSERSPYVLGLEFTSITETKRNDIIQYVYDRQIDIKQP